MNQWGVISSHKFDGVITSIEINDLGIAISNNNHIYFIDFEGKEIFKMKLEPSISTNPYIAFPYKAKKTGTFNFEWKDDSGNTYTMKRKMTVS